MAKEYSARHFHIYHPETGSIDDLCTNELRAWTRKRLVVDQIWRAPEAKPRSRILHECGNPWDTFLELVPGGRWLLVGYLDGSVWCYDLDLKELERVLLVPPSNTIQGVFEAVQGLQLYMDQGARLEFKLLVHSIGENADCDQYFCGARV